MRTTLALDEDLVKDAQRLTGLQEKSALVREALKALIQRESARRLARLGGSEPDLPRCPGQSERAWFCSIPRSGSIASGMAMRSWPICSTMAGS
nr:type II toxin-antitoxin system VapB family antitoxin [uncultured Rhodopila sp.]